MSDMEIPYVATVLEQMAGRLIRSETDQGLVVILDDQAQSGWGKAAVYEGMETFGDVIVPRSQALTWLVPF